MEKETANQKMGQREAALPAVRTEEGPPATAGGWHQRGQKAGMKSPLKSQEGNA